MSDFKISGIGDKAMTLLRERARTHEWLVAEEARYILTIALGKQPKTLPPKRKSRLKCGPHHEGAL